MKIIQKDSNSITAAQVTSKDAKKLKAKGYVHILTDTDGEFWLKQETARKVIPRKPPIESIQQYYPNIFRNNHKSLNKRHAENYMHEEHHIR